jgi:hypothetical protein
MFYGFHQPDIAFLNEIRLRQSIPIEATRNAYDKSQVRQNQLTGGLQIMIAAKSYGERTLIGGI